MRHNHHQGSRGDRVGHGTLAFISRYPLAAAAMKQALKDLLAMTVAELKAGLEARGEGKSGNKSWLRRRLHAAIMCDYL